MSKEDVYSRVKKAIDELYQKDIFLLTVNAHERSISHKLAVYLEKHFDEWDVDCEYNRVGQDQIEKALDFEEIQLCYKHRQIISNKVSVYPDIVIHKRGEMRNLLVIEVKKSGNRIGKHCDLLKLQKYKRQLGYMFPLFIEFDTENNPPSYRVFDEQENEIILER